MIIRCYGLHGSDESAHFLCVYSFICLGAGVPIMKPAKVSLLSAVKGVVSACGFFERLFHLQGSDVHAWFT